MTKFRRGCTAANPNQSAKANGSTLDLDMPPIEEVQMKHGECFRLTRTAMPIAQRNKGNVAIMVPEGAAIEVLGSPFDGVRLMDVRYDSEIIMMFTNDMQTHTEKIVKAKTA
jgi:hypothetical protein